MAQSSDAPLANGRLATQSDISLNLKGRQAEVRTAILMVAIAACHAMHRVVLQQAVSRGSPRTLPWYNLMTGDRSVHFSGCVHLPQLGLRPYHCDFAGDADIMMQCGCSCTGRTTRSGTSSRCRASTRRPGLPGEAFRLQTLCGTHNESCVQSTVGGFDTKLSEL